MSNISITTSYKTFMAEDPATLVSRVRPADKSSSFT